MADDKDEPVEIKSVRTPPTDGPRPGDPKDDMKVEPSLPRPRPSVSR